MSGRAGVTVQVQALDGVPPPLPAAEARALLRTLMKRLAVKERSVAAVFGSDERIRDLNRRFRSKDKPTDVLSFSAGGGEHLGDIAISSETARRNARAAGHPSSREARRLLIHGFLHLLDYDHETDDGEMAAMERCLRAELEVVRRRSDGRGPSGGRP